MSSSESKSAAPPPDSPTHAGGAATKPADGSQEIEWQPLYTPEYTADPWAVYERLRKFGPIAPVEYAPGIRAWLVVDYDAALEVLRTTETFSKDSRLWRALKEGEVPLDSPVLPLIQWQRNALHNHGEEHHRLRQPITDSLERVDPHKLRESVERHADRLIDRFAARGEAELVGEYTWALPVLVLAEMCGATTELSDQILKGLTRLVDGTGGKEALVEIAGYSAQIAAAKREHPGADVTSWMVNHPAALDDEELIRTVLLLMSYGSTKIQVLTADALRLLLSDDRFAGDLEGGSLPVDDAIDEVLWKNPPVANYAPHFPVRDVEFHGVRLRKGDLIFISFAAANADSSVSNDKRSGNRAHLAWGAGPHACPAQKLARLIATVAMERLLDRLPDLELAVPVDQLEWRPGPSHRTTVTLPVRFPPAPLSQPESSAEPAAEPAAAQSDGGSKPAAASSEPAPASQPAPASGSGAAGTGTAVSKASAAVGRALRRAGHLLTTWWRGGKR